MRIRKTRNFGATTLRVKRRASDPMKTYDALPEPLRHWLAQAALPWSPSSAKKVWNRARANGCCVEETLKSLSQAEMRMLARDKYTSPTHTTPQN